LTVPAVLTLKTRFRTQWIYRHLLFICMCTRTRSFWRTPFSKPAADIISLLGNINMTFNDVTPNSGAYYDGTRCKYRRVLGIPQIDRYYNAVSGRNGDDGTATDVFADGRNRPLIPLATVVYTQSVVRKVRSEHLKNIFIQRAEAVICPRDLSFVRASVEEHALRLVSNHSSALVCRAIHQNLFDVFTRCNYLCS